VPAFCLSLGFFFFRRKEHEWQIIIPLALAIVFRLTFLGFEFWSYPNYPYYSNFYRYLLGSKTHQQYWQDFDPQAETIYRTARYLKSRTTPDEPIFIWGTVPSIYALAERQPPGRYTTAYHIIDFNGYRSTLQALSEKQPRYLVVTGDESRPFSELASLVVQNYAPEIRINGFRIYHRIYHD
jgi:hypothetical protein